MLYKPFPPRMELKNEHSNDILMNDEDHTPKEELWNWTTCPLGRVTSISAQFSTGAGKSATQDIIGKTFWKFCDNLDKPNKSWAQLSAPIFEKKRIKKFVFSLNLNNKKVIKIKVQGDPVYSKGEFIGHKGIGYFCSNDEYTAAELTTNAFDISLDLQEIGLGLFDADHSLVNHNEFFTKHLKKLGLDLKNDATISNIISKLKKNKYLDLTDIYNETEKEMIVYTTSKLKLDSGYCVKIKFVADKYASMRIEGCSGFIHILDQKSKYIKRLKGENNTLIKRLDSYRENINLASKAHKENHSAHQDENKKMMSFYENQIDVGIIISDVNGFILNVNYVAADIFNFNTTKEFLKNHLQINDINGYHLDAHEILDEMKRTFSFRHERDISVKNVSGEKNIKEVIAIYPSFKNPQKVLSFLYDPDKVTSHSAFTHNEQPASHNSFQATEFINDFCQSLNHNIESMHDRLAKEEKLNIQEVQQSCLAILNNINDMCFYYKMASGDYEFKTNIVHIEEAINKIFCLLSDTLNEKNIRLTFEVDTRQNTIMSDESIFHEMIHSLLSCIIDICEPNSKIILRLYEKSSIDRIIISISDESPILLEELLDEAESKIDIDRVKIIKKVIEKLGLHFKCKSFDGLGNTIMLEVPSEKIINDPDVSRVQ